MRDEARRISFDRVVDQYDTARPGYPSALFDKILSFGNLDERSSALEIGTGTGIATLPFVSRLGSITGLEPGTNLSRFSAQKFEDQPNIEIVQSRFEDWDRADYDLVFSAQAFHWVQKDIAYGKVHASLNTGGTMALFWNMSDREKWLPSQRKDLDEVYSKYFSEDLSSYGRLPRSEKFEDIIQDREDEIRDSGLFCKIEVHRFPWERTFTAEGYIELLGTYSENIKLEETSRESFFAEVKEVLVGYDNRIVLPYEAVLYLAKKAPR